MTTTEGEAKACVTCGRPFDRTLECKDCSAPFLVTSAEAEFFKGRGLSVPRRCLPCRKAKTERDAAMVSTGQ